MPEREGTYISHYVNIKTAIKNTNALVRALERLGFKGRVEVHDKAQALYGYQGDVRKDKAHVILRRKYVGSASNDIGFERGSDGIYVAHISEYDHNNYGSDWQKKLFTYYGVELSKMEFESKGYKYTEDEDEKHRPRLRVLI